MHDLVMKPEFILSDDFVIQIIKNESGKVFVFCDTEKFTLIPSELYEHELKNQFFKFAHESEVDELVLENKIPNSNHHILFALKSKLKDKIDQKFPFAEFLHYSIAFFLFMERELTDNKPVIFINGRKKYFYILIYNKKELVFLNSFQGNQNSDICYHSLNSLRETGIKPSEASLWFSGRADENDSALSLLRQYFTTIRFLPSENSGQELYPMLDGFQFI